MSLRSQTTSPTPLAVWTNLLVVYIVWGSTYIAIALVVETMPALIGAGLRFAIAAVLLVAYIAVRRGPRALALPKREWSSAMLIGVLLLGVGIGTASMALAHVPTGIAALIIASTPLWIICYRALAGDRPGGLTLAGVAVGIAGLAWIALPGGTESPTSGPAAGETGSLVGWTIALLVGSIIWGFGSWVSPRLPLPRDTMVMTTYQVLAGAIVLTTVGLLRGERLIIAEVSTASWLALVYLVVLGSLIAYTSYVWLLGNVPISLVSTYAYVNPVVAVVLGTIVFGEAISADVIVGITVVLGGVVLVVTGESRRRVSSATTQRRR